MLKGILECSGRPWSLLPSRRKSIEEPNGDHLVLGLDAGKNDETKKEKIELMATALRLAQNLSLTLYSEGRWRILLNGPGLAVRPTFHIHIVFVKEDVDVKRLTDPIVITE